MVVVFVKQLLKTNQSLKGDIIAVLPFGNSVAQIQVTGQNIHDMFVKSLGSILQVDESGKKLFWMKMVNLFLNHLVVSFKSQELVFTMTQLFQLKNVSCQLTFWIQKLVSINHSTLTETYYLVTNDFLAAGGDGFTMLGGPREEGPSMDTVFADYLTRADLSKYAVINPNSRTISISSADFAALNKKKMQQTLHLIH